MKQFGILVLAALTAITVAVSEPVDAKRIGGGGSMGAQRPSITPRTPSAAPTQPGAASQPVMPAQPGAAIPAKPATAAAAAQPSGMSRWLGPVAGLAAGLGIAALLSHFGLGEEFASILLIALLAIAAVVVVRMLLARKASPQRPAMQYAGPADVRTAPATFDAPAWGGAKRQEPVMPAAETPSPKPLPPGFDANGFAQHAKRQFQRLQAAYDAGDRQALSEVMTPEMFAEVSRQLAARVDHHPTEIVNLNAGVLEVTTEGKQHWASVRYTGLLREDGDATSKPIDEVWNLTKPVDGSSGWLLAGIQQTA
jgi:predicted lipid-binding transport protein (Tim44 family)